MFGNLTWMVSFKTCLQSGGKKWVKFLNTFFYSISTLNGITFGGVTNDWFPHNSRDKILNIYFIFYDTDAFHDKKYIYNLRDTVEYLHTHRPITLILTSTWLKFTVKYWDIPDEKRPPPIEGAGIPDLFQLFTAWNSSLFLYFWHPQYL